MTNKTHFLKGFKSRIVIVHVTSSFPKQFLKQTRKPHDVGQHRRLTLPCICVGFIPKTHQYVDRSKLPLGVNDCVNV